MEESRGGRRKELRRHTTKEKRGGGTLSGDAVFVRGRRRRLVGDVAWFVFGLEATRRESVLGKREKRTQGREEGRGEEELFPSSQYVRSLYKPLLFLLLFLPPPFSPALHGCTLHNSHAPQRKRGKRGRGGGTRKKPLLLFLYSSPTSTPSPPLLRPLLSSVLAGGCIREGGGVVVVAEERGEADDDEEKGERGKRRKRREALR